MLGEVYGNASLTHVPPISPLVTGASETWSYCQSFDRFCATSHEEHSFQMSIAEDVERSGKFGTR